MTLSHFSPRGALACVFRFLVEATNSNAKNAIAFLPAAVVPPPGSSVTTAVNLFTSFQIISQSRPRPLVASLALLARVPGEGVRFLTKLCASGDPPGVSTLTGSVPQLDFLFTLFQKMLNRASIPDAEPPRLCCGGTNKNGTPFGALIFVHVPPPGSSVTSY